MNKVLNMRRVMTAIATAPSTSSFASIIEEESDAFQGLDVAYATNSHDSYIQQIRIDQIEQACPLVTSLFAGSGLLFYSDKIMREMRDGPAPLLLDFSIAFDKNICENMRCYVRNVGFSKTKEMQELLLLVRGRADFNYDFLAYLVEEYEHMFIPNNMRPFDTLYALKVLDHLDQATLDAFPRIAVNSNVHSYALQAAQDTLTTFLANGILAEMQLQQRVGYAVLLKALSLVWAGAETDNALGEVAKFCKAEFGKFPKRELYFAWKLMGGDGKKHSFFMPAVHRTPASLKRLKGMSWDLTMLRWTELMSGTQRRHALGLSDFFVPFVASTDQKFREMIAACPLKAIVIDRRNKMINSVFCDEYAFQVCLQEQMARLDLEIGSLADQARRHAQALSIESVQRAIDPLEDQVQRMMS